MNHESSVETPQPPMNHDESLCITKDPPSSAPSSPQPSDDQPLAQCITPGAPGGVFHPPRKVDPFTLTPTQHKALELMLSGLPETQIAHALNIGRTTLYRWRTFHPAFIAELNRRRIDAWDSCRQRLRHLLPRALAALGRGIKSENPHVALQAARAVLAHAAPDRESLAPSRRDVTTPEEFVDSIVQYLRQQKGKDLDKPISDKERQHVMTQILDKLTAPLAPSAPRQDQT